MEVRQQNAAYILHDIECNPGITNAEIAHSRGLSIPTISNIVNILKSSDMIMMAGTGESSGGRRPFQLSLYPQYQSYIGVSIAKHTIYLVLVDFTGRIREKRRIYREFEETKDYWEDVTSLIMDLQKDGTSPCRIGLALPGFVDYTRNIVLDTYTLGVPNVSLNDIYSALGNQVTVGDSGRLAGLAQIFGKTDIEDAFFVLISRRISGILLYEREVFPSKKSSLDIGTMIVDPGENTSDYGIPGSFLELCSASRVIDQAKACSSVIYYEDFFEALENGDGKFIELWDAYLKNLSVALHNIYAIYGADIVIGGEMAKFIEPFAERLRDYLRVLMTDHMQEVNLRFSIYGEYDDAYGAALEARDFHISEELPIVLKNAAANSSAQQKSAKTRRKKARH